MSGKEKILDQLKNNHRRKLTRAEPCSGPGMRAPSEVRRNRVKELIPNWLSVFYESFQVCWDFLTGSRKLENLKKIPLRRVSEYWVFFPCDESVGLNAKCETKQIFCLMPSKGFSDANPKAFTYIRSPISTSTYWVPISSQQIKPFLVHCDNAEWKKSK